MKSAIDWMVRHRVAIGAYVALAGITVAGGQANVNDYWSAHPGEVTGVVMVMGLVGTVVARRFLGK